MTYENPRKKPGRNRPPRVLITYDHEVDDHIETYELPFVVGVLADLSGAPVEQLPPLSDRKFVQIDCNNFDRVLEDSHPRVKLRVRCTLPERAQQPDLEVALKFRSLADFSPDLIASQIPVLERLLSIRDGLYNFRIGLVGSTKLADGLRDILANPEVLTRVRSDLEMIRDDPRKADKPHAATKDLFDATRVLRSADWAALPFLDHDAAGAAAWLADCLNQISRESGGASLDDPESVVTERLSAIDHAVALQLDEVMHHPDLQRLEATWCGLRYFLEQTEPSNSLRIRVLNVSKRELKQDLEEVPEFDQSAIFKKIYQEEYEATGGCPFTVLLGDYYFDCRPPDVTLMENMAGVAATAHAPFVVGAGPAMFNLKNFEELSRRGLLEIRDGEWSAWTRFREREQARFVGLALPRLLLRLPYGRDTLRIERFDYDERITDHDHYLWGNPAFAVGARIADSFNRNGWFTDCCDTSWVLSGLPAFPFRNGVKPALPFPLETWVEEVDVSLFANFGFVAINLYKVNSDLDVVELTAISSCYKPKLFDDPQEHAADFSSASLACSLALGRFAHYLRWKMRDHIGGWATREMIEQWLNQWLSTYVLDNNGSGSEMRAKVPLRYASVELTRPEFPEVFYAVLTIQPHFLRPGSVLRTILVLPDRLRGHN
jgi:type VI secretion system protein ImpC